VGIALNLPQYLLRQRKIIPQLILNLYPSVMAFSTRLINAYHTGPCVRVRRSSDNTEMDIGFSAVLDANGVRWLDTTQLLAFAGSASAYVTIWYNQQHARFNASQSIANKQPQIVNAGALVTSSGKPALYFNGSAFGLEILAAEALGYWSNVTNFFAFAIHTSYSTASTDRNVYAIINGTGSGSRIALAAAAGNSGKMRGIWRRLDTDAIGTLNSSAAMNTTICRTWLHIQTQYLDTYRFLSLITNGVQTANAADSTNVGPFSNTSSTRIDIGSYAGTGSYWNGTISELIFHNVERSDDFGGTTITNNQKLAFNTP